MTFEPRSEADTLRLITEFPLAWVISLGADGSAATPLPLLAETNAAGRLTSFLGHFSCANPQVGALRQNAAAIVLFMGPHGYISPELVSRSGWIPTWNYAIAHFDTQVEFVASENDAALAKLVDAMEHGRPHPWTVADAGDRYSNMAAKIIAFRAHVRTGRSRFKLGQDESPATRDELLVGLAGTPLGDWMRDFTKETTSSPTNPLTSADPSPDNKGAP